MEIEIVSAQFDDGNKVYFFDPKGCEYHKGDEVVVSTVNGNDIAKIVKGNFKIKQEDFEENLKPVLRKLTKKDRENLQKNEERAKEVFKKAEEIIKKYKLDMKLLRVKYAFDSNKLIFIYSSDTRVDFRELLKEFASTFKCRIELKQIGIRDEAKLFGGLGPCGKEICCSRFLKDLDKVSLKYAKNQGLALNTSKLSGMCGRLMCCLAYENNMYVETLSKMPKINSRVRTKDGEGVVVYNNILKETVSVKIEENDGININEYSLEEVEKIWKD